MLGLREVHAPGATRVCIGGHHLLTGGADGVVSLFTAKTWPKSAALWSFNCHEGAVTDVVLADALALALSCGRDGRILLHENIFDTTKLVSRVICQVTGEVRCLQLDVERRRVYIAGDSLRCLDMAQDRFKIHTIPLVVPFPIVSLAVSPCGGFIAMASASGELGVVSAPQPASAPTSAAENTNAAPRTQFVFRSVLSPTAKKDDAARYRMSWCATKVGGLMLLVPTATEVQVYQLKKDGESGSVNVSSSVSATLPFSGASAMGAVRMRAIGGLHDRQLTDLHGAVVYRVTQNRLACVMASRDGIFIGKVEAKSLALARHTSESYTSVAAVTDVQVNGANGDVVVGLSDGRVSLLRKASLKEWRPAMDKPAKTPNEGAGEAEDQEEEQEEEEEGELLNTTHDKHAEKEGASAAHKSDIKRQQKLHKSERRATRHARHHNSDDDDDGFIDDGSEDEDGSASDDSGESATSTSNSDDASSDSEAAPEDFRKVVVDLQRTGASLHANDDERPSRWRDDDGGAAALAHAEREAEQQRLRSRFLDDEAEEGSAESDEDVDDDDRVGDVDRNRGSRNSGRGDPQRDVRGRRVRNTVDADGDEEGGDDDEGGRYDTASVEGLAEDEEDARGSGHHSPYHNDGRNGGSAASALQSGRLPAVQDYSFQVGATPAGEEGSCYLAYNSVGYIHCSREATTVHFHDISYPAVRVQLRDTILMGSLSPVGAGFVVVPAEPADGVGSVDEAPRLTVFYHAFTPLGAQSEWRVALLPGETVRCMAAGIRYLAVATSHYLRIFSLSGLELAVLSKCQRIVTMVGTTSRKLMSSFKADFDPLAIVTLSGTGELQMEVMDVGARAAALPARTIPLTELPDGSTHQLQWLGWSEDGLLHTADTAGVVRMYTEDWGGSWVPVYDPRTLVDQSYALWVYGVSESALLAYRYSRSDPSYPAAAASGLSTELVPLFLPLTRTMGEEGRERWDKVLRQQIRSDELKRHSAFYTATIAKYDELHDHHLLQFFDTALKGQQTTRALELAMLMEIHDRVVKCAQLANNSGYAKLVPKLLALYEMRMAAKSKRRCTLPLKETVVSDKKKDELLRKLLGQMLPQDGSKKGKSSASPAVEGSGASASTAVTVEDNKQSSNGNNNNEEDKKFRTVSTPPQESMKKSPTLSALSPSAASTATTIDGEVASAKSAMSGSVAESSATLSARRHISFAREVAQPSTTTTTINAASTAAVAPSLSQASSTSSSAFTNDTTASAAPAGPRKVSNPFAKPTASAVSGSAPATAGPVPAKGDVKTNSPAPSSASHAASSVAASTHQTRLPTVAPAMKSPPPKQATLLGASQFSTPPRTVMLTSSTVAATATAAAHKIQNNTNDHDATAASPTSTSLHTAASVPTFHEPQPQSQPQQQQHQLTTLDSDDAAMSLSTLGGTPEDRRVSAGHTADSPAQPRGVQMDSNTSHPTNSTEQKSALSNPFAASTKFSAASGKGFVARELPTHTPVSSVPVDPFLEEEGNTYNNTSSGYSKGSAAGFGFVTDSGAVAGSGRGEYVSASATAAVSMQSLLDVGHEETAPVVRSDSFGEALRKRYREDEEAEDELDGAPLAAVPKLTL